MSHRWYLKTYHRHPKNVLSCKFDHDPDNYNDGDGNFSRASAGLLPRIYESGGVVCAADIDKDGRLELFIGGRVIPGKYPQSPRSYILKNSGPRYIPANT